MLSQAHCTLTILPYSPLMAPSPSLRGSKAQLEKSQSQSQQMEQPQSRHYSMSVPDAEFQCTERDQSSKRQFSSSHQHTGFNMQPQLALLSCFHHQDDRDAIYTTARILGVRAAKVQVRVVNHLPPPHAESFQLKCWQTLTFCTRLECRVVSATSN